ncbi:MAG: RagB/SusD family nutrient uptake outer membrane protein [Candidatus Azobacteroides sp.]|nr:RagB/SusD family nutrient uptake outer membrane protein [Candidatus Azobacteroides sp.]
MKNIRFLFSLLFIAGLFSCSDSFLDVQPTTEDMESDYYSSEEKLQEALVAAYDPLQWCDYSWGQFAGFNFLSDAMSDDIHVGGADYSDIDILHLMADFRATPEKTLSDLWTVLYSGVNRSNIAINKTRELEGLSEDKKQPILAEALVLRAFYYSWLWKLWGNVPYYTINPSSFVEQIAADEVYEKVMEDLDEAIGMNVLAMKGNNRTYGRVTQAMAMMLRTKVVLYQKDESRYTQALTDMKTIIGSGQYDLVNDFADLWEEETEWSEETI